MSGDKIRMNYCAVHRHEAQAIKWDNAIVENEELVEVLYLDGYFTDYVTHFISHLRFQVAGKNIEHSVDDLHDGFVVFSCLIAKFDASNATGIERENFQKKSALNLMLPTLEKSYKNSLEMLQMASKFNFPSKLSDSQLSEIISRQRVTIPPE